MAEIDDLPIWIVPFLTSLYFEENNQDERNCCVCKSRKLCRFRPFFCVPCQEGHLCKKMFKAGKTHYKHEKLQVCKVTGRNSIHVKDIQVLGKEIVGDVRDYKYNHELAFSLLGNDVAQKQMLLAENKLYNREVCKWCGRSTRALNQKTKTLCSLGCALESVFNMTLQEIHEAQLGLPSTRNATDAPHLPPQDSQINETKVIEHVQRLQIVPNNIELSRNAFDGACDKHEERVEEEEDAIATSLRVDHEDNKLQSDCVNGSLQIPGSKLNDKKRTRGDLDKCSKTHSSQLSLEDVNLEPSIQACSISKSTRKLDNPNKIQKTSQRVANKGIRQREDAMNSPPKMSRIMKAPYSVSRKVSIDLDMLHNLCLLAYGEVHPAKENVENDAPPSS